MRAKMVLREGQVTRSSNSPAQLPAVVGVCETKVVALLFLFCASSGSVPPVAAFLPKENSTNGAFVVRLTGVQPAATLVTVVVVTINMFNDNDAGRDVSPRQLIVADLIPSVFVKTLSKGSVQDGGIGIVPAGTFTLETA